MGVRLLEHVHEFLKEETGSKHERSSAKHKQTLYTNSDRQQASDLGVSLVKVCTECFSSDARVRNFVFFIKGFNHTQVYSTNMHTVNSISLTGSIVLSVCLFVVRVKGVNVNVHLDSTV